MAEFSPYPEMTTPKRRFSNLSVDAEQVENLASATVSGYASPLIDGYVPRQIIPYMIQRKMENEQLHSTGSTIDYESLLDIDNQSMDDACSQCTAGPDILPSTKQAYISSLAHDLLNKAAKNEPDEKGLERACVALPRHLKTFALKMESSDLESISRDVVAFVHTYSDEIAISAIESYIRDHGICSDIRMGYGVGHSDNLDRIHWATGSLPDVFTYKDFISKHPAYEWLLQTIRNDLYMDTPGAIQTHVGDVIMAHLSREALVTHGVSITVDWDLALFLQKQKYNESPDMAVERALTVTGSEIEAQAVTTAQYLDQAWPSSGSHLLDLIKQVACAARATPIYHTLPDGTHLAAWPGGPKFKLDVSGKAESIAVIGEQLAWLGSALRSSSNEPGVAVVGAFVRSMGIHPNTWPPERQEQTFFCNIGFGVDVVDHPDEISNAQCWFPLFRRPVIATGFPILLRPPSTKGLDISLDTLTKLTGASVISQINNKLYFVGFSSWLVPTSYCDNIMLWHMIYNKDGGLVSHLDVDKVYAAKVEVSEIHNSRHILAYCSEVGCHQESADVNQSNHEAAIGERERLPWAVYGF
ncbi:hypothetical protein MKX08_009016 [Trichoderma sp. CBMAI-0020]|nr:hypothetical protein MKX08_009016 [Trichoderma sp. CBMAI-0020]WOD46696.1 hypothetical protein [Trichoderma atroviride]